MAKRRVLPRDFLARLRTDSAEQLVSVYEECAVSAYQAGDQRKRHALFFGDTPAELMRWLVEQGVDPNEPDVSGSTPLYEQALQGRVDAVRTLVELGADVNRPLSSSAHPGLTPLHAAALSKHPEAVEALIELGADVNAREHKGGETPLEYTIRRVQSGRTEVIDEVARALVNGGALVTPRIRQLASDWGRDVELIRAGRDDARSRERGEVLARLAAVVEVQPQSHKR